jgi:pimeloyl-ACP methyl ester carboxylesterase
MEEQDAQQLLNHEANKASKTMGQVLPVLIVPGLNTPASFFREMASFLRRCGFPVQIAGLPQNGLADIEASAEAVHQQIEKLKQEFSVKQVVVVGHCMGGMITKYLLDHWETYAKTSAQPLENPVRSLITLGTGFTGAEGVAVLKRFWQERHPGQRTPAVFDQLLQWNLSLVRTTADVAYHSLLTVWDMMVRLPNGLLKPAEGQNDVQVVNHVMNDPAIDHLTLALNLKSLKLIERLIREAGASGKTAPGETTQAKPSF